MSIQQKIKTVILTNNNLTPLIARLALGTMILPHGLQKTFGLFGGYGLSGTLGAFTEHMGIPWIFAFLAIMAEFLGGLGLIVGLFSRIASFGVGATMVVAMFMMHWQHGFFMNWYGNQKGENIEFFILAIALSLIVIIDGGGRFSMDNKLAKYLK